MADANGQNLDLAQILATLANLPQGEAQIQGHHQHQHPQQQQHISQTPVHPDTQDRPYENEQLRDPRLGGRPVHSTHPPPTPQSRTSTPTPDSTAITEWKHGIRHVSKIAAQNPNFASSIRKLMKDQERNVRDWSSGRTRLVVEQKHKLENEKTQRAALSLTGIMGGMPLLRTPERDQEELSQFDQKVYRACQAMVDSQSSQLKGLGVPFFGVRLDLILGDDDGNDEVRNEKADASQETKVTKKQLLELQRKMLNHLTELYGD